MEPFKGMRPAQVIGAVLYREERPTIPEGASASPDVLRLMEHCWKQDPAQRPQGFSPVVEELARVVKLVGDPRNHSSSAANDVTSSPGAKRSGGHPASMAARTAPPTISGSLGASPLHTMPVQRPVAATAPSPVPPVQDPGTDRAALMALYFATNGPPEKTKFFGLVKGGGWSNRNGWGTSRPIGGWYGVTVDGPGRVIKLDLRENNLKGRCLILIPCGVDT